MPEPIKHHLVSEEGREPCFLNTAMWRRVHSLLTGNSRLLGVVNGRTPSSCSADLQ